MCFINKVISNEYIIILIKFTFFNKLMTDRGANMIRNTGRQIIFVKLLDCVHYTNFIFGLQKSFLGELTEKSLLFNIFRSDLSLETLSKYRSPRKLYQNIVRTSARTLTKRCKNVEILYKII